MATRETSRFSLFNIVGVRARLPAGMCAPWESFDVRARLAEWMRKQKKIAYKTFYKSDLKLAPIPGVQCVLLHL